MSTDELDPLLERLDRIEAALELLVNQRTVKDFYTTEETARLLGKRPFTVREWCRLGRIVAIKKESPRGGAAEWLISHEELLRVQNLGIRPLARSYPHRKQWD